MRARSFSLLWVIGGCLAASVGCQQGQITGGGGGSPSGTNNPSPTPSINPSAPKYYDNVLGIIYNHCLPCHTAGGLEGQFALDTYAGAQPLAAIMDSYTAVPNPRLMPPWPPEPSCGGGPGYYEHERLLSAAEIQTIHDWYMGGSQAGNPANAPTPTPTPTPLPAVDQTLDPGGTFTFGGTSSPSDLYECFRTHLSSISSGTKDMIRANITPGNTSIVHHIILFREPNGSTNPAGDMGACGGVPTTGGLPDDFLYGWVPGAAPLEFPANTGMALNSTDAIVMQVHYHNKGTQQTDHSTAALWFSSAPVSNLAVVVWAGTAQISLPPNTTSSAGASCTVPSAATLLSVAPHMHTLGTKFHADWVHGTTTSCLIDEQHWSFGWQGGYMFTAPKQLSAGDTITTQCTWDNTTNATVTFGEGTGNEMCFDFMYVVGWTGSTYCGIVF